MIRIITEHQEGMPNVIKGYTTANNEAAILDILKRMYNSEILPMKGADVYYIKNKENIYITITPILEVI